jgi:hypothetical protein
MQQHSVPQQIASYEFRLVGDMTLKQFGWLASGAIVGLLIYSLPIIPMIKWSLILTAGFTGFAFAFLPIEERPLSTWLVAFFQAIFSPTLFIWKKSGIIPDFFHHRPRSGDQLAKSSPPVDRAQLNEYLKSLPIKREAVVFEEKKPLEPKLMVRPKAVEEKPAKIFPIGIGVKTIRVEEKSEPRDSRVWPESVKEEVKTTAAANFVETDARLPLPAKPAKPNLLAGIVLGRNEEMVEGAILEIKNAQGMSVRALKTNKLGQFMIATPLENGTYQMEIEKEGLSFDIIKVEVRGEIVLPMKIKAK